MALKGILQPGDHVITSSIEHNAMWRPLKALERARGGDDRRPLRSGRHAFPRDLEAAIRPATRLIALQHASNVLGTILPIAEIGRIPQHTAFFSWWTRRKRPARIRLTWRRCV